MKILLSLLPAVILLGSCQQADQYIHDQDKFPHLEGDYLGQDLPGDSAVLFAPGIVGTGMYTRDITISPDGDEIFFCVSIGGFKYTAIICCKRLNGVWTSPEVASFSKEATDQNFEPALSSDGQNLFFLSTRDGNEDIWMAERQGDGWGETRNLGAPVSTEDAEYFPSLTNDGTIYFTRSKPGEASFAYRSRFTDGSYREPELLPEQVNCGSNRFNVYVSRNEDFVIIPAIGMEDSYGGVDYYISFRSENDSWSEPQNMGPELNTPATGEYSASISPDGKYLFFMSNRSPDSLDYEWNYKNLRKLYDNPGNGNSAIYWISTGFIEDLRKQATWN